MTSTNPLRSIRCMLTIALVSTPAIITPAQEMPRSNGRDQEVLLSSAGPDVIIERSLHLVDASRSIQDRHSIAVKMFDAPDSRYLPALLATLRDPRATRDVKWMCIYPLSRVPDKRVVDYLIEFVADKEIGREADEQLIKILGVTMHYSDPSFDDSDAGLQRKQIQQEWRQWWKEHRHQAPLFSKMAYTSDILIFTSKEKYDPQKLLEQIGQ